MPTLSDCIRTAIDEAGNDQKKQNELMIKLNTMFDFFNKYLVDNADPKYPKYKISDNEVDFAKDMRGEDKRSFDLGKVEEELKKKDNVVENLMGKMFKAHNEFVGGLTEKKFHDATKDKFNHQINEFEYGEESIQKIKDLRDFKKTLEHFNTYNLAADKKISLENDGEGRLENGIGVLKTCFSADCAQIVNPIFAQFQKDGRDKIGLAGVSSSNSQEFLKMRSKTDKIFNTLSKHVMPSITALKEARYAAEEYMRLKRREKGRSEDDNTFQPWSAAGRARYKGARVIMETTDQLLNLAQRVSGKERESQRKEARNLPKYEEIAPDSVKNVSKIYGQNSTMILSFSAQLKLIKNNKEIIQPKYQNIVRTSGNEALRLMDKIKSHVNERESLGDEPLYDAIKDKAKLYRSVMTIKKELEKNKKELEKNKKELEKNKKDPLKLDRDIDFLDRDIDFLQSLMGMIPPSKESREISLRNGRKINMDQLFSETVADQIADEQNSKFYRALPKGNKSVEDIQRNCAAKILAVNILKKVYGENAEKAYPIKGTLKVYNLFSAENIKKVANKIKDNAWFKLQDTDTLAEKVVEPGVINDNVFNKVGVVIGEVRNNLAHYVNNIQENKDQKEQEKQKMNIPGKKPRAL